MEIDYGWSILGLSALLFVLIALAASAFAQQVHRSSGARQWLWLLGGAMTIGTGIWSTHFIGISALNGAIELYSLASLMGGAACGVVGLTLLVSLENKIIERSS